MGSREFDRRQRNGLAPQFFTQSDPQLVGLGLGLLLLVGAIDYALGFSIRLTVLYVVPLMIFTWVAGRSFGLLLAVVACVSWAGLDHATGRFDHKPALLYWEWGLVFCALAALTIGLSRLKGLLADARFASRKDSLTGLVNKGGFYQVVNSEMEMSRRYRRPLSIAYIDLDNFKAVNDRFGHHVGDELPPRENVKVVGYLDFGIDGALYRDAFVRSLYLGGLLIATVFVLALLFGRRLVRRALAPLRALQTPLARLAQGETEVQVSPAGDREIAAIGSALNVTIAAIRQRDAELRRLAEHDPLTGLVNRASFMRELEAERARLAQQGGESAVLFFDLDQFKYINDTLGHAAGDRLLVQVANVTGLTQKPEAGAPPGEPHPLVAAFPITIGGGLMVWPELLVSEKNGRRR